MKAISILIPTFNGVCTSLVADLQRQAEALAVSYEIIVADDGSTDADTIAENRAVNQLPHCRYIEQPRNVGRAAIRNFLARQAQFDWLLFIDSDMTVVNDRYLSNYLSDQTADVIDGCVCIGGDAESLRHNLRYRYEKASEHEHTAERRRQAPYRDFHTANFLIRRELMRSHPFDDRFRYYGYEDVLFGKQLRQDRIAITHIDNPMGFCTFESNADFVAGLIARLTVDSAGFGDMRADELAAAQIYFGVLTHVVMHEEDVAALQSVEVIVPFEADARQALLPERRPVPGTPSPGE